jgi:hypothetical protein
MKTFRKSMPTVIVALAVCLMGGLSLWYLSTTLREPAMGAP